jgi:transcriptional antiterminator NusG
MTDKQQEITEQPEIQEEETEKPVSKSKQPKENNNKWYILQCYSGQEYKVQSRIEKLIETKKLKKKITKVLIPEESTIEIKDNKRLEKNTKIYPGYIFVEMESDESVWFELRKITGVAKFIGSKSKPTPITENEVLGILNKVGEKTKKIEVDFEKGDVIKVVGGPFRGYTGNISEINAEKGKLKAMLSVFGRETPVELDFNQVEKTVK